MTIIKQGDKYYLIVLVRKNDIKPSEIIKNIIGRRCSSLLNNVKWQYYR